MRLHRIALAVAILLSRACSQEDEAFADPQIVVQQAPDANPIGIPYTWPLTEATAKRIMGPVQYLATSQMTATSAGTAFVAARVGRVRIVIENTSTENVWWAGSSPSSSTTGFLLAPGASQAMLYSGALYVYSASGTAVVCVSEGYNGQ